MNFNKLIVVFLLFFGLLANAQQDVLVNVKTLSEYPPELLKTDEFGNKYFYDEVQKAKIFEINGENVVIMDELVLKNKIKFNNQLDQNYYYFLNKKLNRVYPLFVTALEQYEDIQDELKILDKDDQRKYVFDRQKNLADQYEKQLRNLTTTEGKVFAKLMNRATGKTVFDIIKELRGGWSAFWWNVKGNIADVNIKAPYNPHVDRSDEFIESLLQSNWKSGYLQPYPGYQNFKIKK